jgi:hypothetical protein
MWVGQLLEAEGPEAKAGLGVDGSQGSVVLLAEFGGGGCVYAFIVRIEKNVY